MSDTKEENVIETPKATVSLLPEGIVRVRLKANAELELADAMLIEKMIGEVGGGKKYPILINGGLDASVNDEVRRFSAGPESNQFTIADGIVANSLAQKLIANFYITFNKPMVPTKVFTSEEKAIEWLKGFIKG